MPGPLVLLVVSLGITIVAVVISVLVHELGHAIVGYATGLRVARVNLGPLELRDFGRPRVRFVPSLMAGVVLVPYERDAALGPLRWSLVASTAAGPLVGLAFGAGLIALAGGPHFREPAPPLEIVGQVSVILGVLNLLPLRSGETLADGRRVFSLLLRTRESGHILVATLMLAEALSGRRPRDWDPTLLAAMERSPNEPFARLCLYEAAMDRGEIDTAGRHLDAAVELRKEDWTSADAILFNEAAYFAARHRGDARAGRAWLGIADGWTVVPYMRARAEAAVLCAEGRGLEGRQRAVAGLAALDRAHRRDEDLCREQLAELARGAGTSARPLPARARAVEDATA
ncbi:MAG TPA: M50 family metallopeptidase [Candidatus Limnocylindria bacterium]|nr:M50 family metallopeptidase [Candidatus Limnocylindria bacterium]